MTQPDDTDDTNSSKANSGGEEPRGLSGIFGLSKRLLKARKEIGELRLMVSERDAQIVELERILKRYEGNRREGFPAEKLVWILGGGRTGSTWLAAMAEEMEGQSVWFEPRVGDVFAPHRFERYGGRGFVMNDHFRATWLRNVRETVLDGANVRFPDSAASGDYLIVKEPGGSAGATVLMESLPESKIVFLIRDPRDVVASWLDAARGGGWQSERKRQYRRGEETFADKNPDAFVRSNAQAYVKNIGNAGEAYERHGGRKVLIRYEDLVEDTLFEMRRMYEELEVPYDEKQLAKSVLKHSWSNIPEEKKGEGKFYRKGVSGGWREDLTQKQIRIVQNTTSALLEKYYPETPSK